MREYMQTVINGNPPKDSPSGTSRQQKPAEVRHRFRQLAVALQRAALEADYAGPGRPGRLGGREGPGVGIPGWVAVRIRQGAFGLFNAAVSFHDPV